MELHPIFVRRPCAPKIAALILSCLIVGSTFAQYEAHSVNIGDVAPPLLVRGWVKGMPVQQFEKGRVYVVEFWATWCRPCLASMARLSALAAQYRSKVTFLAVDIYEQKIIPLDQLKAFVDSMGQRMDFSVAAEDSNAMVAHWLDATGTRGIPVSFVVDAQARLAWIGHPSRGLGQVLPNIVNNNWDVQAELTKRNSERRLKALDDSLNYELRPYIIDPKKADSGLLVIRKMVADEPRLKYAPFMSYNTFALLLKTNRRKAYKYGKQLLPTPDANEPGYSVVMDVIEWNAGKIRLSTKLYRLAAKAYQRYIDDIAYPEILDMSKLYSKMAAWYGRGKQKSKAIDAAEKAVELLKNKKEYPLTTMSAFQAELQYYKDM